jgi:penicillin amidase
VTGLVVLLLVVGASGVWAVRHALPEYDDEVTVPGLGQQVTVYRDDHGIPQLYAANADDLFRAQGYVHAQERFWEMDFRRHVTSGRLSELFGAGQVDTDKFLRTMGWRHVAEQEWSLISPESRQYLQDYADGVNAYLAGHGESAISLEYSVLKLTNSGYAIEKWDPVDSLAWLKAMAYDLWGNVSDEIERATLLADGLSQAQVEQLYPAYPFEENAPIVAGGAVTDGMFVSGQPTAVPARVGDPGAGRQALAGVAPVLRKLADATAALPGLTGVNLPDIGSNSFVIAGSRTSTGMPLLANDPHLSPSMPGIWYQMGLHCTCDFNVEGFTFSGMPGVVIGHNARIAWGFTNLDPDVSDLYLEKVQGESYLVDGVTRTLITRQETIKVAGGDPVTISVRSTNNGPIFSDVWDDVKDIMGGADAVSLRWTALDPGRTMDALFALNRAQGWKDFRTAASLFEVPAQNLIYADTDGNIGYQSPGKIPVRGKGDGRYPAPGWDSAYDWTSYIPFDELPNSYNPASGYIVTANQAVTDTRTYPYRLTDDWSYGYRSQRIVEMIQAAGTVTPEIAGQIQFDAQNTFAKQITPALLAVPVTGETAAAQALLRGWDFQQRPDGKAGTPAGQSSAAAAYFNAVYRQLLARTFDELPHGHRGGQGDRWFLVVRALLETPDSPWWDDRATPQVEYRDDILAASMRAATTDLNSRMGDKPADWRWGRVHTLELTNATFGDSGIAPIEWLFNRGPAGVSGGSSIVNATGWDPTSDNYEVNAVPSMRMVVDLGHLDASRWIQLTGDSGHAFSPHYWDQFELWRTGQTLPMRWDEAGIRQSAKHTQTLHP